MIYYQQQKDSTQVTGMDHSKKRPCNNSIFTIAVTLIYIRVICKQAKKQSPKQLNKNISKNKTLWLHLKLHKYAATHLVLK